LVGLIDDPVPVGTIGFDDESFDEDKTTGKEVVLVTVLRAGQLVTVAAQEVMVTAFVT